MFSAGTSKKLVVALCILAGAATCLAGDIVVGEVKIAIPDPTGFAPVTPEMEPLYKLTQQFVPASNQEFLSFIPASEVETALSGQIPDLTRRLSVQSFRQMIPATVSTADFEKIKTAVQEENRKNLETVRGQFPDLMDKVSKGLEKEFDVNAALSVSSFIPAPIHLNTPQLLAFSALTQYEIRDEGDTAQQTVASTTTFALVRGKMLYLYCYADKSDMQWTREISRQWAEAILAENPGGPPPVGVLPTLIRRIDWSNAGLCAVAGAVGGAIIGAVAYLIRKRKSPVK